jgi:hypothetical protein
VAVLRRAARTAADRGATDSAVTYLRRALAEPPGRSARGEVLVELGLAEAQLDGAASTGHLLQAYALLEDAHTRAELATAIARIHVFASPPGVATAFAREAAEVVPADLPDARQALIAIERMGGYMHGLPPSTWRTAPAPEPEGDGTGAQMLAAALAFETMLEGADRERAVRLGRFALDGDRLFAVDSGLFWVIAATTLMLADDDLGDFWDRVRTLAHARGSLFTALTSSLWEGFWRWRRGELTEALAGLRVALDQDRMWHGTGVGTPYARTFEIGCHLDRGDVAAARRAADAGLAGPHAGEGDRLLRHAIARLLVVERRYEEALAAVVRIPSAVQIRNPVWHPWRTTGALALHGLGRTGEAVPLLEEEVRLLRLWGAPTYLGTALRHLGELTGDVDALRESVDLLAPTTCAVELARARLALGRRRDVADDEAVPLLRAASDTAHAQGAEGIRAQVCAALGVRGRTDEPHLDGPRLTLTERRVLELTAEGLGVREVAERLFMTPGTVHAVLEAADGGRLKFVSSLPTDASSDVRSGVQR